MTASVSSEVGTPLTEQTMTFGGSASHISWDEILFHSAETRSSLLRLVSLSLQSRWKTGLHFMTWHSHWRTVTCVPNQYTLVLKVLLAAL